MDNNIRAFPLVLDKGLSIKYSEGMTLLDYFAGQVIQGIYSNADYRGTSITPYELAEDAFTQAAALLEVRKQYIK